MNADASDQVELVPASEMEPAADPFAVDLFAANRANKNAAETGAEELAVDEKAEDTDGSPVLWHSRLARLSENEAHFSSAIASLPPPLSSDAQATIVRTLTRYTHVAADEVSLQLISLREGDLPSVVWRPETAPRVFISVALEPDGARLACEIISGFGSVIVDRMLGGDGTSPEAVRALSKTEQAVFEFICLGLIRELNAGIGEPLLRLEGITTQPPEWLAGNLKVGGEAENGARNARGLILSLRVWLGPKSAVGRLYLTSAALAALDAEGNPLLARRARTKEEQLKGYERYVPHVPLQMLIGRTEATVADLAQLERGDVVLLEQQNVTWQHGKFTGQASVRAGDGHNLTFDGSVAGLKDEETEDGTIRLLIENISVAPVRAEAKRLMMEEEKNLESNDEESAVAALDELMLTLYVELGTRLISLSELANLRAGQILDLGCKATDPVDLTTGERRIARGELIDIEGRLGVRITHVLG